MDNDDTRAAAPGDGGEQEQGHEAGGGGEVKKGGPRLADFTQGSRMTGAGRNGRIAQRD